MAWRLICTVAIINYLSLEKTIGFAMMHVFPIQVMLIPVILILLDYMWDWTPPSLSWMVSFFGFFFVG